MNLEFAEFKSDWFQKQRELFADCFPEGHENGSFETKFYNWKFHQFPAKPTSFEYAAFHGDDLVGYYAAIPFSYVIHGNHVVCGMVCDVMTHSKMRGKGVFTKIGRFSLQKLKEQSIGFVSGYPIRPEVIPGHVKVGWEIAFELPLHFKVLRFNGILKKLKIEFLSFLGNFFARVYNSFLIMCFATKGGNEFKVLTLDEFSKLNEYEEFFSQWSKDQINFLVKDKKFLKWRLSAPETTYRIFTCWTKGVLTGVAIGREMQFKGVSCLALLDFMTLNDKVSDGLHQLVSTYSKNKIEIIVSMMTRTTASRLRMFKNGFLRGPTKFRLIVNALDDGLIGKLTQEAHWNLMWIDSDDG